MKIINNVEQGSPEWFAMRKGKMTASHAQAIGNCGKGLDTYIIEIMAEYFSSYTAIREDNYTNQHIERGIELEPQARELYELETGFKVDQVTFIEIDEQTGCSPDGLVGEDGGIEIKCLNDVAHFKMILNGKDEIDTKYLWQIQMFLLLTGRKWCDYVGFNPNFEKSLLIHRIEPDEEMQKKIQEGIDIGKKKMQEIILRART